MAALVAVRFMIGGTQNFDLHDRISNGTIVAVVSFVEYPVVIITLMLASRRSGPGVVAYLGGGYSALAAHCDYSGWSCRLGRFGRCTSADARWPGLGLVARTRAFGPRGRFALLVVACGSSCRTIAEELVFRGFMFRGFVYTQRDAIPSIVLISLIWSLLHVQYAWFGIAAIFVFGVLLGLVRWTTGSTTLTILLHMLYNLESFDRDGIRTPLGSDGEFIFFGQ